MLPDFPVLVDLSEPLPDVSRGGVSSFRRLRVAVVLSDIRVDVHRAAVQLLWVYRILFLVLGATCIVQSCLVGMFVFFCVLLVVRLGFYYGLTHGFHLIDA